MTRMLSPARLLPAAGCALLCLMLALGYARAQTTPAAPTIDSVTPGDTQLNVAWTAPAGETGITAYDVRHIETSADETVDANWMVVDGAWTSGALEYTITMLTNGTQYDVQVRAVNSNRDGTWSGTEIGTPALPAPTISSVRADDRALLASWNAPTGTISKIEAYDIRYMESSADETVDANWTVKEDADGRLTYAITGLTNGTEYDVQVRGVDENDVNGAWSSTTSATPEDHGDTLADATSIATGARIWGAVDSTDDEDYFRLSVSSTADYWIYTLGDLETVGELLDSNGVFVESDDYGGVLPNPDNFFLWRKLQSGTYYIKVTGYGSTETPYVLRIRAFTDSSSRSNAATLGINGSASGTIDPEDDEDYFKLQLSETTEVAIRASGFPDTVGEVQNSFGVVVAYNDDGYLPGGRRNFLIRESLPAGTYYVKVTSFAEKSDGPYSVYATVIAEPGSSTIDAQPLTLGDAAGGIIDPAGDVDYFSLTLDETTFVIVGGVSQVIDISGALIDSNSMRAPVDSIHFDDAFIFQGRLDADTYYLKVTGKEGTETGRYTVRAIQEGGYTYFVNRCSNILRSSGISDPLYGCQWHLNNTNQFRNSAGHDIRVEEVWPTYTGDGINVAVVDDGMHYGHEDLTDNVNTSFNHNYDPNQTDIYNYFEDHGTAVAGLIAAKDNALGVRGVASEATIYGYNYLVEQSDANEADAMSRNATTTAVSNNSWGPGDSGRPQHATELWELAVKDGVTNGYGGKGVFYAWAGGNGGEDDDRSNLDEYANFYAVTAVCAVGHDDKRSSYSEPGSNLWVCGPSSSGRVGQPRIATTDNGNRYRGSFGGTSAATPIVSGVVALVREANNALTWRDAKLILAASARKNDPDNTGWEQGAFKYGSTTDRYKYNDEYGFGMVDAKAATDLATGWTKVPELREITSDSAFINLAIPDAPSSGSSTTVSTSLTVEPYVEFIEFVEVNTHFNHLNFRDLTVELVSPSGAVSVLTTSADVNGELTSSFRFGSARHLGEDAAGEWTLRIKDAQRGSSGALKSWALTVYGHGSILGEPEIVTVTPGGGTLTVEWDAPTDTGATAITSYDLRYIRDDATDRSDDKWTLEVGAGTPTNRSHTVTGLEGAVKYEFQLRAHNGSGHGPWSKSDAEEPTTVSPSAPTISSVARGDRTLAVVWAEPLDTGGAPITAYDVRYIETSADETVDANWTVRDNAWRSGELRYVISNLTNATQYDVQVRAVNRASDGLWSGTETGTPLPDDIPIILQLEDTTLDVQEDAGIVVLRAVFTTTLNSPPAADFTFDVTLTTTDLGTTSNDDYTPPPSSANFVASDFSQTIVNGQQRYRSTRDFSVVIIDDTSDESDENLRVTVNYLTPGLVHLQGGPQSALITIRDNDHVPVSLGWERTNVSVDENAPTVTISVIATTTKDKIPDAGFTFDVSVATSDGSASQPDDYTQLVSTVTFDRSDFSRATIRGQRTYRAIKQVEVDIADDTEDEQDESFDLTARYLAPGLPHLLGGPVNASVTITDNDHVPVTIHWEQTVLTVDEGNGVVTLRAIAVTEKDKMPETGFSFDVTAATSDGTATQSEDYRRLSTTLHFSQRDFSPQVVNGQDRYIATKDATVAIMDDTVDEPNEDFVANLSYSGPAPHLRGGPDSATVFITDNDHVPVVFGWDQTSITADEKAGTVNLLAVSITTKDKIPESGFTFDARVSTRNGSAKQPADYTQLDETVTFNRGDFQVSVVNGQRRYRAEKSFTVTVVDDGTAEPNEEFTVTLAYNNPGLPHLLSGDLTATITITDDTLKTVDLNLSAFSSDSRVSRGEELTYQFTVRNDGQATSTGTTLRTTLDPGVTFVSSTPEDLCSKSGGRLVNCDVGTLARFASVTGEVSLQVEPTAAADIRIVSEASSNELDLLPEDNRATVLIELIAAPERVTGLRATGGSSYIELSWGRPSDNGSPITAYDLQRKEEGVDYVSVSPDPSASATSYRDNQVTADKTYTYQLRAVNEDGDAEWSNEASATVEVKPPPPPPPPPELQTSGFGGGFFIVEVNIDPEFSEGSRTVRTIEENSPEGTDVGELVKASDEDGDALTYALTGIDAPFFTIDEGSGQISVLAELDHETRDTYLLRVQVSDGNDGDDTIKVDVTVTDVDEPPVLLGTTSLERREDEEGAVAVYTASDPERGEVAWSVSGPDSGVFSIGGGMLYFATTTDYEAPADADEDNTYDVIVEASDGNSATSLEVAVTVTDVDEPPEVTGPASPMHEENRTDAVAVYMAADPEGVDVAWTVAGEDARAFSIDGGRLTFTGLPDYEAPADANEDNVYSLTLAASDGNSTSSLEARVTVSDVDEPPEVSGPVSPVHEENETDAVAMYSATDPEGADVVWRLSGDDAGAFSIAGGMLTFVAAPDFEMPADADQDSVFELSVQASDVSGNTGVLEIAFTVVDVEGESIVSRYDQDSDDVIDRAEALAAAFDYFADLISKQEAIEVVSHYFAN